jgi:hypothetical protein
MNMRQCMGLSIALGLLGSSLPAFAADKLTNSSARQALLQFFNCASKNPPCTIEVLGVLEVPQQNTARADVTVLNVTLKVAENDAVTAYAFGRGGGTRLWSGAATAFFSHYNDGRWVLTQIVKAEGGSWEHLNIVVGQREAAVLGQRETSAEGAGAVGSATPCQVALFHRAAEIVDLVTEKTYSGGCKNGWAEGTGEYSYSFKMAQGPAAYQRQVWTVKGTFHDGKLDGVGNITMTEPNRVTSGEFRANAQWNTILRGPDFAFEFRDGKRVSICRANGQGEDNCVNRARLLGSQRAACGSQACTENEATP